MKLEKGQKYKIIKVEHGWDREKHVGEIVVVERIVDKNSFYDEQGLCWNKNDVLKLISGTKDKQPKTKKFTMRWRTVEIGDVDNDREGCFEDNLVEFLNKNNITRFKFLRKSKNFSGRTIWAIVLYRTKGEKNEY